MKTNYNNLLGKQVALSATDAAWHLNAAICESMLCSEEGNPSGSNIFGRPLSFSSSHDISFSIGFGSTGLRSGIILCADEISSNLDNIAYAVRAHIPLVVFASVNSRFQVNQLAQSGAAVFSAAGSQEALDLLLISYRVAELSLIPVVVCVDETLHHTEEDVVFPGKDLMVNIAGNIDHSIASPTASQQIIFGKNRKRIPGWFNLDNPVSLGAAKQLNEAALETAAQQEYFYGHLDEIILNSFQEFNKLAGRNYSAIEQHDSKNAEYLVISYGSISTEVIKAVDEFRSKNKNKIAAARLLQVNPFPANAVKEILSGKKTVTVLEQATPGNNHSNIFKEVSLLREGMMKIFSGIYGSVPAFNSLLDVLANMIPGGKGRSKFLIDIEFTKPVSDYPKHQVLMQAIEREYPEAKNKTLTTPAVVKKDQQENKYIPQRIRKYKDQGPVYTKLSRFYDDTAGFFLSNREELVADPFQAIPVMPPSTANFNSNGPGQNLLPNFYSANCTGCGECFLHCPQSAINPLVIAVEQLLKAGIAISATNGYKVTQLIPLVKNIAKAVHEEIKAHSLTPSQREGEMLNQVLRPGKDLGWTAAFKKVALQMNVEGEKFQSAKQDMDAVAEVLKEMPVSITDIFFNDPDLINKGSGELFTLAIDVNACTGCSVCATVCNDEALIMTAQNSDLINTHQSEYQLWEQLPDTNAVTISRLLDENKYNPFSAILLSRHFNLALHGRSSDQPGDASKSMVHLITAIAEAAIQPRVIEAIKMVDELISGLSQQIHAQLGSALPSQDIDALSKALSEIREDKKPFDEVIEKIGMGDRLKLVDTKTLKRKVDLAKSLKTLSWLLNEGATGNGRARMGFVLDGPPAGGWSNTYPWNNFTAPVIVNLNGSSPELAKGMVQGHIRQLLDNIKIIRRAALEINGTYEPGKNDIQIASITWHDLTEKEKDLIPPIIVMGNRAKLAGKELHALIKMLDSDWPVKAIVLDDAAPGVDDACAEIIGGIGTLLPVLALQNAHVIKSALAVPQHLFSGLSETFKTNKPALAWIYTPAITRHLMAPESFSKLHALSLNTRAYTLFNFNPQREAVLLSSKINIAGNPQSESLWVKSDLSFKEEGEDKILPYALTWSDWAYTLRSWREKFILFNEIMGKPILVADYIELSEAERNGKTPVIYRIDHDESLKKYKVPDEVIAATEACVNAWQVLREISGELSEFPEKLQKKVEAELAVKYEKDMADQQEEYEHKISNIEQDHLEKIRIKLKEKLVSLSQQKISNS